MGREVKARRSLPIRRSLGKLRGAVREFETSSTALAQIFNNTQGSTTSHAVDTTKALTLRRHKRPWLTAPWHRRQQLFVRPRNAPAASCALVQKASDYFRKYLKLRRLAPPHAPSRTGTTSLALAPPTLSSSDALTVFAGQPAHQWSEDTHAGSAELQPSVPWATVRDVSFLRHGGGGGGGGHTSACDDDRLVLWDAGATATRETCVVPFPSRNVAASGIGSSSSSSLVVARPQSFTTHYSCSPGFLLENFPALAMVDAETVENSNSIDGRALQQSSPSLDVVTSIFEELNLEPQCSASPKPVLSRSELDELVLNFARDVKLASPL